MRRPVYNHPQATHAQTIPVLCQEAQRTQEPARLLELARLLRWHGDKLRGQRATHSRKALRGLAYQHVGLCCGRLRKLGVAVPSLPWGGLGPPPLAMDADRYWRLYSVVDRLWECSSTQEAHLLDGLAAVVERYECQQEGSLRTPRPSNVQIYSVAGVPVEKVVALAQRTRRGIVCCPSFWARLVAATHPSRQGPLLSDVPAYCSSHLLEDTVLLMPQHRFT